MKPALLLLLAPAVAFAQSAGRFRVPMPGGVEPFEVPAVGRAGPADVETEPIPVAEPMPVRALAPGAEAPAPALVARVPMAKTLNSHWERTETVGEGREALSLSVHFDSAGEAYLSVKGAGWAAPVFVKFEAGMRGDWQVGAARYRLSLDARLLRRRVDNLVEIRRDGRREPALRRRIQDLVTKAYESGVKLSLRNEGYRVFYSDGIDLSGGAPRPDPASRMLLIVRGSRDARGEYSFSHHMLAVSSLAGGGMAAADLPGGRRLGLKLDGDHLELYDLN